MDKIIAYTDGSCLVSKRIGGIGVLIIDNDKEITISKGYSNTTISRMEMRAILEAIKYIDLDKEIELKIYSDSEFIVNSFNKGWLNNWIKNNFKNRTNSDLWKMIVNEINIRDKMTFSIKHTRGHRKDLNNPIARGNNVADMLADYKQFKTYIKDIY